MLASSGYDSCLILISVFFLTPNQLYLFCFFVLSAWQSNSIACSPPSSSVAFSTILETQQEEDTNLAKYVSFYVCCA